MAIKFIDGMRVVIPDVVARDIDDVMYEDADNPTEIKKINSLMCSEI